MAQDWKNLFNKTALLDIIFFLIQILCFTVRSLKNKGLECRPDYFEYMSKTGALGKLNNLKKTLFDPNYHK
jgi:hypothetical protein